MDTKACPVFINAYLYFIKLAWFVSILTANSGTKSVESQMNTEFIRV